MRFPGNTDPIDPTRYDGDMVPTVDQIKGASKDVAWEYGALLGAALEMAQAHPPPINHQVQESFLVHVRNLAEFFRKGVKEFKRNAVLVPRDKEDIYAVDFCNTVSWDETLFCNDTNLIIAINKTLSHMTYLRDQAAPGHVHFEGYEHVHGTVKLMRLTFEKFLASVKPEFKNPQYLTDIEYWLNFHTAKWRVCFRDMEREFESRAAASQYWKLNQTPDGCV